MGLIVFVVATKSYPIISTLMSVLSKNGCLLFFKKQHICNELDALLKSAIELQAYGQGVCFMFMH